MRTNVYRRLLQGTGKRSFKEVSALSTPIVMREWLRIDGVDSPM